ncbi:SAM-dependent methyltransferase [Nonomuraea ferruginea]
MSLRFHEIAEARHRILNPLTDDKLDLLGEICRVDAGTRQLDLACGKGEMLNRWSARYGHQGIGVDISKVFLEAARDRAGELEVADRVQFVEADSRHIRRRTGSVRHRVLHRRDLDRRRPFRHPRPDAPPPPP